MAIRQYFNALLFIGATIVPWLLVFLGTQSAYWSGTIASNWLPAKISLLFGSIIGIYCISSFPVKSGVRQTVVVCVGSLVLVVSLFWLALMTSCANGDCL